MAEWNIHGIQNKWLCVLDADAHADADAQSDAQSDADEIFHVHDKNDRPNVSSVGLPGHHI